MVLVTKTLSSEFSSEIELDEFEIDEIRSPLRLILAVALKKSY